MTILFNKIAPVIGAVFFQNKMFYKGNVAEESNKPTDQTASFLKVI